jgi:hypothetical protein
MHDDKVAYRGRYDRLGELLNPATLRARSWLRMHMYRETDNYSKTAGWDFSQVHLGCTCSSNGQGDSALKYTEKDSLAGGEGCVMSIIMG